MLDLVSSDDSLDNGAPAEDGKEPARRSSAEEDAHKMRREGGVRREMSDPVVFHAEERRIDGWALNVSRGGLRAILEEPVQVGDEFEMSTGDTEIRRGVRVVWARAEKGGAIVGVAYKDVTGSVPPPSMPPPGGLTSADSGGEDD